MFTTKIFFKTVALLAVFTLAIVAVFSYFFRHEENFCGKEKVFFSWSKIVFSAELVFSAKVLSKNERQTESDTSRKKEDRELCSLICFWSRRKKRSNSRNVFQRLEMTYMFENPVYNKISLTKQIESQYPRYGLYSYCEGQLCDSHRRNIFTGWPVLFIVGNADSFRQVRSLGSVAYRLGENQKEKLDYFSIDFNEEISALFGGVLDQQMEFVRHSIERILKLYKKPRTIILVGNSIGGLLSSSFSTEKQDEDRTLVYDLHTWSLTSIFS